MKLKDIVFLEDYYFGKQQPFNCIEYTKLDYENNTDFFSNQFSYIKKFENVYGASPQTYQTNISEFVHKHKTISTYQFLQNQKSDNVYFYPINIFGSPVDCFEEDNIVFDKIHYKVLKELKFNDNLFLIINASSEGFLPYSRLDNLHNWLIDNSIDLKKVFFIHSNYNIFEYAKEYKEKFGKEECINVVPYLWSIPFFNSKFKYNGFTNETLYKQNYLAENKKSFNLLIRTQKTHRTQLLCDLENIGLLDNNIVSYDFNLEQNENDFFNKFEKIMEPDSNEFKRYWNQLKEFRLNKPKRTIDYEDLKSKEFIKKFSNL